MQKNCFPLAKVSFFLHLPTTIIMTKTENRDFALDFRIQLSLMISRKISCKNLIDSNFQKLPLLLHFSARSWKPCHNHNLFYFISLIFFSPTLFPHQKAGRIINAIINKANYYAYHRRIQVVGVTILLVTAEIVIVITAAVVQTATKQRWQRRWHAAAARVWALTTH